MTDTDKLKGLAEELKDVTSGKNEHGCLFVSRSEAEAILALIAENRKQAEMLDYAMEALNGDICSDAERAYNHVCSLGYEPPIIIKTDDEIGYEEYLKDQGT